VEDVADRLAEATGRVVNRGSEAKLGGVVGLVWVGGGEAECEPDGGAVTVLAGFAGSRGFG